MAVSGRGLQAQATCTNFASSVASCRIASFLNLIFVFKIKK
jgi:hypothetical protein